MQRTMMVRAIPIPKHMMKPLILCTVNKKNLSASYSFPREGWAAFFKRTRLRTEQRLKVIHDNNIWLVETARYEIYTEHGAARSLQLILRSDKHDCPLI